MSQCHSTTMNRKQVISKFVSDLYRLTNSYYPCLCLCLGFSQITLTRPFLLMTLHFSQIGFTEDLTFTAITSFQKVRCLFYHIYFIVASPFFNFFPFFPFLKSPEKMYLFLKKLQHLHFIIFKRLSCRTT